ncbi:hypothetical protein BZA70DRAFT_272396 [Myxozyma melibiosi]|uniref:Chromatin modification-related protein EAF1 n=1 Tax=Myxozyma melibiosi TaxID=54550 RepID=A0ABR1FFC5_9ASCO
MDFSSDLLDRLRFENIERRRQLCSDVVKNRKRKLSELYFLSRSPLLPITDEIIASEDDYLMAFLEKNDLESGHLFDESSLPSSIYSNKMQKTSASDGAHASGRLHPSHIVPYPSDASGKARQTAQPHTPTSIQQYSSSISHYTAGKYGYRTSTPATKLPASVTNLQRHPVAVPQSAHHLAQSQSPAGYASPALKLATPVKDAQSNSPSSPPAPHSAITYKQPFVPQERMTTRVSSGAIKQKSVSEIMGTPSRQSHPRRQAAFTSSIEPELVARSSIAPRNIAVEEPPVKPGVPLVKIFYSIQASPLAALVPFSHKSLTTENYLTSYLESTLVKNFARMDELKREKKWSLRQPQRFRAPKRAKAHWDHLLSEMQVTAQQCAIFRKQKLIDGVSIASMMKEYWVHGKTVCVTTREPRTLSDEEIQAANAAFDEKPSSESQPVGAESAGTGEAATTSAEGAAVEAADESAVSSTAAYGLFSENHFASTDPSKETLFRDMIEELPIVPINKFAMIPLNLPADPASWNKKGQADQSQPQSVSLADMEVSSEHKPLFISEAASRSVFVKAPMPPALKYVEFGVPTIWLPQDDATLLKLASEFVYNWDVVAAHMNIRQSWGFHSNIERRTPWECFERWMQLEPNFQISDLRGPFARHAQIWLEATSRAQAHTKRRMMPMGITNDNQQRGQRRLRWGGMLEAIRKSIRKREGSRRFGSSTGAGAGSSGSAAAASGAAGSGAGHHGAASAGSAAYASSVKAAASAAHANKGARA